jgi:uncharacterized iron-regulated membrane protein
MRNIFLKIHLWTGIAAALLLLVIGVSGALLVFEDQIDAGLNPHIFRVQPQDRALSLVEAEAALEKAFPGHRILSFDIPQYPDHSAVARVSPQTGPGFNVAYNQFTGQVLGKIDNVRFTRKLHIFHAQLLAGRAGSEFVGWGAVFLLFLALSGIYLWWPRKRIGVDWNSSGTKFQFDLHNTVRILSSIALLCFAVTGIIVHWEDEAGKFASQISGTPLHPVVPQINAPPRGEEGRLNPDELLAMAIHAAPGAAPTAIDLPDDPGDPALVLLKYPEDRTPAGRTRIYLDPYTGQVLASTDTRKVPVAVMYASRLNREIHTGDIYGWPSKLLACFFSLMLPILAISGPLLWWHRRVAARRPQAKRSEVAA